ncbi:hypothetical protein L917_07519 [Phytophthora nicotianae]|uniref:C2H2-type domain-containing protein n=2 Tax=Phytophthora nicotianae TaxID=4792 RepID=W2LAT3_PHYNI|nr:hypothetical protein L917_07519 [Phytophthora nicotianae]
MGNSSCQSPRQEKHCPSRSRSLTRSLSTEPPLRHGQAASLLWRHGHSSISEINSATAPRALDGGYGVVKDDSRRQDIIHPQYRLGCEKNDEGRVPGLILPFTAYSDDALVLSKPTMHHTIDKHVSDYPQYHDHSSSTDIGELKRDPNDTGMIATPIYELDPDMMGMLANNWNLNADQPQTPVADWSFDPAPANSQPLYDPNALMVGENNQPDSAIVTPTTSTMGMTISALSFCSGGSMINSNSMQQPMNPPMDPFIGVDSNFVMPYQACETLPTPYNRGATYNPQFDGGNINAAGMNQCALNRDHLVDNQLRENSVPYFSSNNTPQTMMDIHPTFQDVMGNNALLNEVAHPPAATLAAMNGTAIPELALLEDDDSDWNGSSSGFSAVGSSPLANNAIPTDTTQTNVVSQLAPSRMKVSTNTDRIKKPKRIRRLCSVAGCGKRARSQDLCIAHGGGRRCMVEGCEKSSQGGNMCIKHGGGKRCKYPGCDKAAQTNALCKAHGGGPRCQFPGCTKSSQGGGFCRAHGGGKRCAAQGCNKGTQRGDFCALHGGSRFCEIPGCMRNDRGGGFCAHHGGGKRCSVSNCNRSCRRNGLCSTHLRLLGHEADDKVANAPTPAAISAAMSISMDVSSV